MNIKNLLKRIIDPNHYSSEAYIQYLRNSGVHIGEKTIVYAPRHTSIDIQKPHLISIGSYCKITTGVIILAHDYSIQWHVVCLVSLLEVQHQQKLATIVFWE